MLIEVRCSWLNLGPSHFDVLTPGYAQGSLPGTLGSRVWGNLRRFSVIPSRISIFYDVRSFQVTLL